MLSAMPCSGFLYLQFLAQCHPYILFMIFTLVILGTERVPIAVGLDSPAGSGYC